MYVFYAAIGIEHRERKTLGPSMSTYKIKTRFDRNVVLKVDS